MVPKVSPFTDEDRQRWQWVGHFIGYNSVNYVLALLILLALHPIMQEWFVPLAALVVPISKSSLTKLVVIFTLTYWAPLLWVMGRKWRQWKQQPAIVNKR